MLTSLATRRPAVGHGLARSHRRAAAGFDPKLAGCTLALWADEIEGVADTDPLPTWSDTSGSGLHVTASGTGVTYQEDGGPNGRAAVAFGGVHRFFRSGVAFADLVAANEGSVVAVMRQAGAKPQNALLGLQISTELLLIYATYDNTLIWDFADTTNRVFATQPAGWDDAWHICVFVRRADGTQFIRVDGVTLVSLVRTPEFSVLTTGTLNVGSQANGGLPFQGDKHALHVYNRGFSDAEVDDIEAGWSAHTGIVIP